jgi:hypothetical protein
LPRRRMYNIEDDCCCRRWIRLGDAEVLVVTSLVDDDPESLAGVDIRSVCHLIAV